MSFSVVSKNLGRLLSQQINGARPPAHVVRSFAASKGETINRRDLAKAIAEEHDLSIVQTERIIKSVFDTIVEVSNFCVCGIFSSLRHWPNIIHSFMPCHWLFLSLFVKQKVSDKGVVRIADFGTFDSLSIPPRTYRVPNTGGTIDKPASERPRFKAFKAFKESVNK